jgi:hypothetical protein
MAMEDSDLRDADLSHLRVQDMTADERAEMRRRYVEFVRRMVRPRARPPAAASKQRRVKKWMPGVAPR